MFSQQNAWNAHQEAVALCTAHGLTQAAYFLQRDLAFMKEVSYSIIQQIIIL